MELARIVGYILSDTAGVSAAIQGDNDEGQ
jgi:hypothetical protein